jgi:SAM-dependent methyltransferase
METIKAYLDKGGKWMLRMLYGFDRWHITALDQRPYAVDIIKYANQLSERRRCVEIGCGLGDIIRNVNFGDRLGLDNDVKVLEAARLISRISGKKHIQFSRYNFPDDELRGQYNLIIMVNWIHHISPPLLKKKLFLFAHENLFRSGEIIVDTVQDKSYEFNHDIRSLVENVKCTVARIGEYHRQREVWAIKKSS